MFISDGRTEGYTDGHERKQWSAFRSYTPSRLIIVSLWWTTLFFPRSMACFKSVCVLGHTVHILTYSIELWVTLVVTSSSYPGPHIKNCLHLPSLPLGPQVWAVQRLPWHTLSYALQKSSRVAFSNMASMNLATLLTMHPHLCLSSFFSVNGKY